MAMNMTSPIGITPILDKLLKNPVVLDVETTISAKGNPYNQGNKLVTIQLKQGNAEAIVMGADQFHDALPILESASCIIAFNAKFDISWVRRQLGFVPTVVWDCQLAEFLFSGQTQKYPSLQQACEKYGLKSKLDIVKTEYWEKGIDTTEIPFEVLAEYGAQDVNVTWQLFQKQVQLFSNEEQQKFKLFRLQCNDLLVLQEMENNGIVYDTEGSLRNADDLERQVQELERKLYEFTSGAPINFDSRDHVSVLLYGGTITEDVRVPVGVYKTGAKVGQPRYKIITNDHQLPRLVEPIKGSELKKEGFFSTDESTLLSVKANKTAKKLIEWLLSRSKIMKLKSTYLLGLPKTIDDMGWKYGMLHSNLNQCVASTGRLSSTKPNQQNLPKEAKKFCVSRYDC
jgi:DNA polymerase-1